MFGLHWKTWAVIACLIGLLILVITAPPSVRPLALLIGALLAVGAGWWSRRTSD